MSDSDDAAGAIVMFLIMAAGCIALACLAVMATVAVSSVLTAVGASFGSSVSLYNYALAFKKNVKRERPTV